MINRTNYNFKTPHCELLTTPSEGALTYRTIQFSMSSECFHSKSASVSLKFPILGTKNLRAGYFLFSTRPLRPSFIAALDYFSRRNCQRVFSNFLFFRTFVRFAVAHSFPLRRTATQYLTSERVQAIFKKFREIFCAV